MTRQASKTVQLSRTLTLASPGLHTSTNVVLTDPQQMCHSYLGCYAVNLTNNF
jgi:hypothetical protein